MENPRLASAEAARPLAVAPPVYLSNRPAKPAPEESRAPQPASRSAADVRAPEPKWLQGCGVAPQQSGAPNGRLPTSTLCRTPAGHYLRSDAARAFAGLSDLYRREFGTELCLTDSYRSIAAQQRVYAQKPALAALPGTSNHGWGIAGDFCGGIESFASREHAWMIAVAPEFGWRNPDWARPGGSRPEPWHWEFDAPR